MTQRHFSLSFSQDAHGSSNKLVLKGGDLRKIDALIAGYAVHQDHRHLLSIEDILLPYIGRYLSADKEQQRQFATQIERLAKDESGRALVLLSFLFDVTKEADYFYRLATALEKAQLLSPAYQYNLFIHLSHLLMMNKSAFNCIDYAKIRQQVLKPLYIRIFRHLKEQLKIPKLHYRPIKGKVLVITNMAHNPRMTGPVWDTLEYAWTLKHKFGLTPIIINTNIWPSGMAAPIWPLRTYFAQSAEGDWPHRGDNIPYFRLHSPWPDVAAKKHFFNVIDQERPSLAINIGDSNFYTDILEQAIPTYTMHFTVDFPITARSRPTYHPDIAEMAPAVCKASRISTKGLVPLVPSYSVPGRLSSYKRADFGVGAKAFVYIVVGHRLDSEVTPDFLAMLETILLSTANGHVFFTGLFSTYKDKVSSYPRLASHSAFVGNVIDLTSFMELCNCYLNPDRTGGGSSAFYALAKGVPVLSLSRGDVAFAAGAGALCDDYASMANRAIKLASQPSELKIAQKVALVRAKQLSQRHINMQLILEDAGLLTKTRKSARKKPVQRRKKQA